MTGNKTQGRVAVNDSTLYITRRLRASADAISILLRVRVSFGAPLAFQSIINHCPASFAVMPVGKALVIDEHGGIDKFHLVSDFAFPEPKAGELLVHVAAASVNPVDTYVRSGAYPAKSFPLVRQGVC